MKWFCAKRRGTQRSWQLALGLAFVAMGLAGCSNVYVQTSVADAQAARLQTTTSTLTLEDVVEEGVLTIGISTGEGAPFVIENAGGYEGIDVDVGAALAAQLGLQAKFVPINNDASAALTRVDVVMGVSTNAPGGLVVASDYVESAAGFFTLGEEPFVATIDELQGQAVGLQEGSASQQLLNTSNLQMTQHGYANIDDSMKALTNGEVSYVLCPAYPGAYLAKEMGGVCFCGTLDTPTAKGVGVYSEGGEESNLVVAVRQAMDTIRDNGVLGVVLAKWVGNFPRLTAESRVTGVVLASDSPQEGAPQEEAPQKEGEQNQEAPAQDGSTAGSNAVTADRVEGGSSQGAENTEGGGTEETSQNGGEGEESAQTE